MSNQQFQADVAAFVAKSKVAMRAVFQSSVQDVIRVMQTPGASMASTSAAIGEGGMGPTGATGHGGLMPVDTGFLRSSLSVTLNAPDTAFKPRPNGDWAYNFDEMAYTLTINRANLGDTIYAVYTANYAAAVEYGARGRPGYFFVRTAAQQWQQIVDANVARFKV